MYRYVKQDTNTKRARTRKHVSSNQTRVFESRLQTCLHKKHSCTEVLWTHGSPSKGTRRTKWDGKAQASANSYQATDVKHLPARIRFCPLSQENHSKEIIKCWKQVMQPFPFHYKRNFFRGKARSDRKADVVQNSLIQLASYHLQHVFPRGHQAARKRKDMARWSQSCQATLLQPKGSLQRGNTPKAFLKKS